MNFFIDSQSADNSWFPVAQTALSKVLKYQHVGFHMLPHREQIWSSVEKLSQKWKGQYDHVAVVGIGGSSLGPQAIVEGLGLKSVTFLENVDGVYLEKQLEALLPFRVAWVFSSKSGSTIETLATIEAIDNFYSKRGQNWGSCCVVISESKDNPLTVWGKKKGFDFLEVPLDVGGRFSVLTPIGLFPATLLGVNIRDFQEGALQALQDTEAIAKSAAMSLKSFENKKNITVFWFYCAAGLTLGRWVQQLWAESLGKKTTRSKQVAPLTSTPFIAVGSVDQHSTLQQMMEGYPDKSFWFFNYSSIEKSLPLKIENFPQLDVLKGKSLGDLIRAQSYAIEASLKETGASTLRCEYSELSARTLGHLFMFMELCVATIAESLDVDAFDQPGVERGKVLTRQFLAKGL